MSDDLASVGDGPREPETFFGLSLGSSKEEVEKHVCFSNYLDIKGAPFTSGTTELRLGNVEITASLSFERDRGLQAIDGGFRRIHHPTVKDVLIELYGEPDELARIEPSILICPSGSDPNETFDRTIPVDSRLWYKKNAFISVQDRTEGRAFGHLRVATYRYMKRFAGSFMMGERARDALVGAGELSVPPADWPQEPQQIEALKFGMTLAEAARIVEFGEPIRPLSISTAVRAPMTISSVEVAGRLDFDADRLIQVSGEFDISKWLFIKSTFIERYGQPHYCQERVLKEWGRFEELYWTSEWIEIGLRGCPEGNYAAGFHIGPASETYKQYFRRAK